MQRATITGITMIIITTPIATDDRIRAFTIATETPVPAAALRNVHRPRALAARSQSCCASRAS